MESTIITMMVIGVIVGSLIGGFILMNLAKYVGKVSTAKYGNSFLICLIATSINYLVWYIIGAEAYELGFFGIFAINLVLLAILYIGLGKIVWKCTWNQSFKANIIWIAIYAILTGFVLSQMG